jgi:hypothetical protein
MQPNQGAEQLHQAMSLRTVPGEVVSQDGMVACPALRAGT